MSTESPLPIYYYYPFKQIFERSKEERKAAVLTTLDQAASDTFKIELGSIPDNAEITCKFEYFMELKTEQIPKEKRNPRGESEIDESEALILFIPQELKARYVPPNLNSYETELSTPEFQSQQVYNV